MATSVATFADLLRSAVSDPGVLSAAYRQFHTYSISNQLLAWSQCLGRGIQPGPLATYPRWRELGRQVRRGEKAITLCMPVTVKHARETDGDEDSRDHTHHRDAKEADERERELRPAKVIQPADAGDVHETERGSDDDRGEGGGGQIPDHAGERNQHQDDRPGSHKPCHLGLRAGFCGHRCP